VALTATARVTEMTIVRHPNANQSDLDGDLIGDACDDADAT